MINLQQSPKNQDVGRGLRKIVACSLNPPRSAFLLTRGAHAPEGYGSWVCVSVCLSVLCVCYLPSHFSIVHLSQKQYDLPNRQ